MKSNIILFITLFIIIGVVVVVLYCRREKYNPLPPTWKFISQSNSEEDHEQCYGKSWN